MGLSLGLVIVAMVGGAVLFASRRSIARSQVGRLVYTGGLPKDARLMAAAEDRLAQTQVASAVGLAVAGVVVGGIVLLAGDSLFSPVLGWTLMGMIAGVGIGSFVLQFRAVRAARPAGPRTATLQQRRLGDYLTPVEIIGQYVMLVFPLLALALGVLVLATADDHAARGWALVIPGLATIPVAAVGIYLQRRILELNQPASGADELRWQEALRAKALRDMLNILIGAGWLFGAALVLSFEWPAGVPGFATPFAWAIFVGGTAVECLIWGAGDSKRGLRRSQQAIRSPLGDRQN
ncbi:hypothetical protein [Kribbella sp. NPDC051718]|uniref:hypothetical protein n=1 Tax=Kribbella sp. NPDC051718 TaxID=3155168 RepID=UPI0034212EFB